VTAVIEVHSRSREDPSNRNRNDQRTLRTKLHDSTIMKISEMKKELESYGISTATILEKSELVTTLFEARAECLYRRSSKSELVSALKKVGAELRHEPPPRIWGGEGDALHRTIKITEEKKKKFKKTRAMMAVVHNRFPKSNFYSVGMRLFKARHFDLAMQAYKRGAETDGCVPCIHKYTDGCILKRKEMIHLLLPLLLEGAIRGYIRSMQFLIGACYFEAKPARARSLEDYWEKIEISLYPDIPLNKKEAVKNLKTQIGKKCYTCSKQDLDEDVTLVACGKCGYYYYCGKECQLIHWDAAAGNHIGECNHLKILKTYHRPYAEEIRDKIIRGDDPKSIPELQELRTQLGLNRPKEDYEELILHLGDEHNSNNRYEHLVARKDGTVHIGSTPETI
jgi:hypothetical protein